MRPVALFIASLIVSTSVEARPEWLHVAIPQAAPHAVDLSKATTFHAERPIEDIDLLPVIRHSGSEEQTGGISLSHLGLVPSSAEFDGHSRKHHHMISYGFEGFHPFGSNVSGSLGTRGGQIRLTWPTGQ